MSGGIGDRARRWIGASLTVTAFGGALALAAACSDPARPTFGPFPFGPDTSGPTVAFLSPGPDSVFLPGSRIVVQVEVRDRSRILSVAAGVLGTVVFGFETQFPDDTLFVADYPITTPDGVAGGITFRVVATDTLGNRSSADRSFILQ